MAAAPKILITGGSGLVGSMLTKALRSKYGQAAVIAADVRRDSATPVEDPYEHCDITNMKQLEKIVADHKITWLINQSAILSLACELNPHLAMDVNINGIRNILEVSRLHKLRVFSASTIATFGPTTSKDPIPDDTIQRPPGLYGTTKVTAELLGEFYHRHWGVDFRCIRYPAVISPKGEARNRVVDFAVQIFAEAIKSGKYVCDISGESSMPFQLVDDSAEATLQIMEAPYEKLTRRTYNVQSFSSSIEGLAKAIRKYVPDYEVTYKVNPAKQAIIDAFPRALDDSQARKDWGWTPAYPFEKCVKEIIDRLRKDFGK